MSGSGDSSAGPSIIVLETKHNESLENQNSCNSSRWHNQQQQHNPQQEEKRMSLLPPRATTGHIPRTASMSLSTIEDAEVGADRNTHHHHHHHHHHNVDEQWRDGEDISNEVTEDNDYNNNNNEEDEDDMAEHVLNALQRKDAMLEEQAQSLERRDMELAQMRRELQAVREEKQVLMQQLRVALNSTPPVTVTAAVAAGRGMSRDLQSWDHSLLLQRVDLQLQDERAERQQDAGHFRAHIDQLTAQLSKAQEEAALREERHAQDLDAIQREMQEFSTLVDDMHATKAALRRTQEQLAQTTEEKLQCQLERDRLVRTLQDAVRREGTEHQRVVACMRAESQALQRATAAAEVKCRRLEAAHFQAMEEVRTVRIEMQQLVAEQAALTLRAESAEQQFQQLQAQRLEERAAAAVAHQQYEAAMDEKTKEIEELRSTRDVQTDLLKEEDRRHASFRAEVAECVDSTQQLEEVFLRCDQRRREAEEHEARAEMERDELRTKLQRLIASSRQELLEQQKLAEEMRNFHQSKLQQLQQVVEQQRSRADCLEEKGAAATRECRLLQTSLEEMQQRMQTALGDMQEMREQRAALEAMLAECQQAHSGCAAREQQSAAALDSLRTRLQKRERAWRELRVKVQRLQEREQRRYIEERSNSLLRMRQGYHHHHNHRHEEEEGQQERPSMNNKGELLEECMQSEGTMRKNNSGVSYVTTAEDTDMTLSTKTSSSMTAPPRRQQQHHHHQSAMAATGVLSSSHIDAWHAKLQALESRNANLEQQLGARQNGYRALLEDRKTLKRQMQSLQAMVQKQVSTLERQHREAMKHLEEALRSRTLAACRETADALAAHESCARSGVVRVVSELMSFIRAVDSQAAWAVRYRGTLRDTSLQTSHDDKENRLRAACDDITRNFLGVEGGWEALLQHSSCEHVDGTLTVNKRRRIRVFLMNYLRALFLTKPTTTLAPSALRRDAGNKKAFNVSFAASSEDSYREKGNESDDYNDIDERNEHQQQQQQQPLVQLLMDCVQSVYGDDTLKLFGGAHSSRSM